MGHHPTHFNPAAQGEAEEVHHSVGALEEVMTQIWIFIEIEKEVGTMEEVEAGGGMRPRRTGTK